MLTDIIIEKISKDGPISFHDFMEMALYYPEIGYYTSPGEKIGKGGDYYTSPYLTNLFGDMIAKQLEEMWLMLDKAPFTIVEYGAGPGALCKDILDQLKSRPEFYEVLDYCIIEKSPAMRAHQQKLLPARVKWIDSIGDIKGFNGCVLANEVVDNFAVHMVEMKEELMEIFVGYDDGLVELLRPAGVSLEQYLDELKITLPAGYRAEINLQAIDWLSEIAASLNKGFLLTIDYGNTSNALYTEARRTGTLLSYYKHSINENFYSNIGQQDITAHVNFSALNHYGQQHGLQPLGLTTQTHFLHSLGLSNHLRKMESTAGNSLESNMKRVMLINNFLMDMGRKMKVLIQQKGLNNPRLMGMQFASSAI
ncbi:MAG: SAM-dependent methyltransferase [Ferruginibacter sp.]